MISKENAEWFPWREVCDGWTLQHASDLHIIQQRMPPGTHELLHVHAAVRQLYFVLQGDATVDIDGSRELIRAGEALPIEPGLSHRLANVSSKPLEFLVISSSAPRADRTNLE